MNGIYDTKYVCSYSYAVFVLKLLLVMERGAPTYCLLSSYTLTMPKVIYDGTKKKIKFRNKSCDKLLKKFIFQSHAQTHTCIIPYCTTLLKSSAKTYKMLYCYRTGILLFSYHSLEFETSIFFKLHLLPSSYTLLYYLYR